MGEANSPMLLRGHLVLLVEDEPLIAFDTEEVLRLVGAEVLVATDFSSAMSGASRADVTAAVLDYRLGQQTTEPVWQKLEARRVAYVVTTGDGGVPEASGKTISKPYDGPSLIAALVEALSKQSR